MDWLKFKTDRTVRRLDLLELVRRRCIGKNSDALDSRQHLLKQPKTFDEYLEMLEEKPCYVPTGPGDTIDVTECNRVVVYCNQRMGIRVVASLAARVAASVDVTMTSVSRRTSSAARSGSLSTSPAAFRYSNAMF